MIELNQAPTQFDSKQKILLSFAGDVYNSATYLKRCFNNIGAYLVTALGKDQYSSSMREQLKSENINCEFVFSSDTKIPGLYSIHTDEDGERTFHYWRNDSAARYIMDFLNTDIIEQLKKFDMFVFSGISLAIIPPAKLNDFWEMLNELKKAEVKIVFDSNYRSKLWKSKKEAISQYELAFQTTDMLLPSIEDFELLFEIDKPEQIIQHLKNYNIEEIVIKNGSGDINIFSNKTRLDVPISQVEYIVDTTSAGDSFNGSYIGSRLSELSTDESAKFASQIAGFVIQHPGAIVDSNKLYTFLESLN
ncbi:sugar kinase [Thalassotalea sp. SU-HH00458]